LDRTFADAMRGPGADDLLRLLRAIYFQQESSGSAEVDAGAEPVAAARALGLIDANDPGRCHLTRDGYRIANFAKEYCNWIDAGRPVPEGVRPEWIAGKRLLDVGCSFGRHLATFGRLGARAVGIELELPYLQLSGPFALREGIARPRVAQATATALPFLDRSFDVVFCRLVLNYVPVRAALAEFARVLTPGGRLILAFGTFQEGVDFIASAKWRGNLRTVGWRAFGLANTILLQLTGHQASLRARGRMYAVHTPTWPTIRWMARELGRHGFVEPEGGFQVNRLPVVFHAVRRS
jgi:SAM-dependent methyltransferase